MPDADDPSPSTPSAPPPRPDGPVVDSVPPPPPPGAGSSVRPGDIVAEKYRVERVLGRGGMGVVVAAVHIDLEQRVALKFLLPEAAAHKDFAVRFAREARAAAKIQSAHGVKVLDVGTLPTGLPYMVMEYLEGEDLKQLVKRCGPMPVTMAVDTILQASEALAEAHVLGVVHRDIKPANLFLAQQPNGDPVVKVLDFGISKATLSTTDAQLTKTSTMMGSPGYVSPEQLTSAKTVDPRSDIWALGIVLYELLTGVKPFHADTMPEVIAAILQFQPDPVRNYRQDVPDGVVAIIDRCLAKSPAQRFQTVAELAVALVPFGLPRGQQSADRITHLFARAGTPPVPGAPLPLGPPHPATVSYASGTGPSAVLVGAAPAPPRASSGPFVWVAIATVLLLVAGGGVALKLRSAAAPSTVSAVETPPVAPPPPPPVASSPASAAAPSAPVAAASPPAPVAASAAAPTSDVPSSPPSAPPPSSAQGGGAAAPGSSPSAGARSTKHAGPRAPTCHMVSYVDQDGNKRFKQECK